LFISVPETGERAALFTQLRRREASVLHVAVGDIVDACSRQKHGKVVQPDGIANEDGTRLKVRQCTLFNIFIHLGFLPRHFGQSILVPLGKNKSGDMSDVNNYRVIIFQLLSCLRLLLLQEYLSIRLSERLPAIF
jgi:hypothetical protein